MPQNHETIEAEDHLQDIRKLKLKRDVRIHCTRIKGKQSRKKAAQISGGKIVHFIRHGEGEHNAKAKKEGPCDCARSGKCPYKSLDMFDPALTSRGRKQAKALQEACSNLGAELVVVSPLSRATETGLIAFAKSPSVPFIAHESIREQYGVHQCDKRRSIKELMKANPRVDYSLLQNNNDVLHSVSYREPRASVANRAYNFLQWLERRPETNIVVVTHSAMLLTAFNAVLECDDEKTAIWFETGELRSTVLTYSPRQETNWSLIPTQVKSNDVVPYVMAGIGVAVATIVGLGYMYRSRSR